MTKQEILNELKQKIIKYVPEIMKLPHPKEDIEFLRNNVCGYAEDIQEGQIRLNAALEENRLFEGRDITLEDVLIALSKKHGEWHCTFWGNNVCHIDEGIDWILNKPLHEQSEETIKFLNEKIK